MQFSSKTVIAPLEVRHPYAMPFQSVFLQMIGIALEMGGDGLVGPILQARSSRA